VTIAPLAGVLADRHDRKLIMIGSNLIRALLIALIPIASYVPALQNDYPHLLLITFAFAAVGQLFSPAEAAAIPSLISRRALITANSMVLATMVITLVIGGATAPNVVPAGAHTPSWLGGVVLFVVAGVLIWLARIPRLLRGSDGSRAPRNPFHQLVLDLKAGAEALGRSPVLLVAFYEMSLAVLVMFMMFTLAPAYVSQVLGI